jgi:hypothetical protein
MAVHARRVAILIFLMEALAAPLSAQVYDCSTLPPAPVLKDDFVPWPAGLVHIEVLANDYDPTGHALQVTGVVPPPATMGSVWTDADGIWFDPAPGAAQSGSFSYQASNGSLTASANVTFGSQPIPPPPVPKSIDFGYSCQGVSCTFTAKPSEPSGVRGYDWVFQNTKSNASACNHSNWRGLTTVCDFGVIPDTSKVTVSATYYTGEVVTSSRSVPVPDPSSSPVSATWVLVGSGAESNTTNSLLIDVKVTSTNRDGVPERPHLFDFGDGSVVAAPYDFTHINKLVEHRYAAAGIYHAALIVQEGGVDSRFPRDVSVVNLPPAVDFQDTASAGSNVHTFTPSVSDEHLYWDLRDDHPVALAPKFYEWDFGDGTTLLKPIVNPIYDAVSHPYVERGIYHVSLRVVDHLGAVGSAAHDVNIANVPPIARFTYDCSGSTCTFDAGASTDEVGITAYHWSFSYAPPVDSTTPRISYTFPGCCHYAVRLVADDGQLTGSVTRNISLPDADSLPPQKLFTVPPCRLYDTRVTGGPLHAGEWRPVTARGNCGIPSSAGSIVYSATYVRADAVAYGSIAGAYDPDTPLLTLYPDALPLAINGVARLDPIGRVALVLDHTASSTTADLVVDVVGYYDSAAVPPGSVGGVTPEGPFGFALIDACRVFDTRLAPPALSGGTVRTFSVAGLCGVPPRAPAVAVNYTLVAPTAAANGRLYSAALTSPPNVSTVNVKPGLTRANGSIVRLGPVLPDAAALLSSGSANAVVDVSGYFSGTASLQFVPIRPCTIDGADGLMIQPQTEYQFKVQGNCGIPRRARAVLVGSRVTNADSAGYLALYAAGGAPAQTTTLNFPAAGGTVSNMTIVPLGGDDPDLAAMSVFAGAHAALRLEAWGYFVDGSEVSR